MKTRHYYHSRHRLHLRSATFLSIFLLSTLFLSSLLLGCGSGKSVATAAEMPAAVDFDSGASSPEYETVAQEAGVAVSGYYNKAAGSDRNVDSAGVEENSSEKINRSQQPDIPAIRKLIRTVHMHVETNTFDDLLSSISRQITQLDGYIEQSEISGQRTNYQNEPIPRNATLTIRIPASNLDSFIQSVEDGGNVTNRSETTEDVTLQYSDIESRKKSLTIEQERLWALLEKADSLESIIALEERLSDIRYQLESLESQLRLYDNQVDYSTVVLTVSEVTAFTPTSPESVGQRIQSGFSRSLKAVSTGLTSLFIGLISLSPFWIPAVILVLVFFSILHRKHRPGKKKKQGENQDPPKLL